LTEAEQYYAVATTGQVISDANRPRAWSYKDW